MKAMSVPTALTGSHALLAILLTSLLMILLAGCGRLDETSLTGATMGTRYTVKLVGNVRGDHLQPAIDAELARLNGIFSTWQTDTEISRFNATLPGMEVIPSADMKQVLAISRSVFELSGGAFEVTLGPLINLWGFGADGPQALPEAAEIQQMLEQTGMDAIAIDEYGLTDSLSKSRNVSLDLSAVAKGYAVDQLASLLEAEGVDNYMVEVGGEIRVKGKNARGQPWQIAIERPVAGSRAIHRVLPLRDTGMATSGDYRNFFEHEGKRYSHTLDPRTGWPVSHNLASVTVLHESAAWADALATAFMVLGADESMRIANANNWRVLAIIRSDGLQTRTSAAMDAYLSAY